MRVFTAVVDSGSFSKAAEKLNISTTAASRYISELEKHLQAHLLQRSTRRLGLTNKGADYYERCRNILAQVEEADALASETEAVPSGFMRISLPVCFGIRHMAPLIQKFRSAYPQVDLEVGFADHYVDMIKEGIDVAIRIGTKLTPTLIARPLAPIRIVPCAAPSYLERFGTPQALDDLKNHRCISYNYAPHGETWCFYQGEEVTPVPIKPVFRSNNGEMIRNLTLAGEGIALQPSFIVGDDLRAGALVPLFPDYELELRTAYAVYLEGAKRSPRIRAFVNFLAESFQDPEPYWDRDL